MDPRLHRCRLPPACTGLLVGLLRAGRGPAGDATAAIRVLASRGTHSDSIREAGAIPLLLQVLQDGGNAEGVEHASGALAHLMMQRAANRDALLAAGGVPLLAALLQQESQAAEYAASSLGALVICGSPAASTAVSGAVSALPAGVLPRFPCLESVLASTATGPTAPPSSLVPSPRLPAPASAHPSATDPTSADPTATQPVLARSIELAASEVASEESTLAYERARFLLTCLLRSKLSSGGSRWWPVALWRGLLAGWTSWRVAPAGGSLVGNGRRGDASPPPEEYKCPITLEVMVDPVACSDGFSYERSAIVEVIYRGNGLSPLTRERLACEVYPNFRLRRCIEAWHEGAGASPTVFSASCIYLTSPLVALPALVVALAMAMMLSSSAQNCSCDSLGQA